MGIEWQHDLVCAQEASTLRARATRYLGLAELAYDDRVIVELCQYAAELEAQAAILEIAAAKSQLFGSLLVVAAL